jgi:hypothetical protein
MTAKSSKLCQFRMIIGMPVSHVWRGYGSALFLEFGHLRPRAKRDGTPSHPEGEMSLMLEWSGRIERRRTILCGSFSGEKKQQKVLPTLLNFVVANCSTFGRLPEIRIDFSNDLHVLSFMTAEGSPAWTLFDNQTGKKRWLCVKRGLLSIQTS